MRIAIIGAGWYGCHIAKKMVGRGVNVSLFDRAKEIFSGASGLNQNRLHQGFHYPRCSTTRRQSRRGFHLFKKEYAHLLKPLDFNLYAIASKASILDFETYKTIMNCDGLNFEDISDVAPLALEMVTGVLDCEEEYVCSDLAREFFTKELNEVFHPESDIDRQEVSKLQGEFDYVIDCTWGGFHEFVEDDAFYETCLYHIYSSSHVINTAITLMDGEFFSIFPHGENQYTVTCVPLIIQGVYSEQKLAHERAKEILEDINLIDNNIRNMEELIKLYIPSFSSLFEYQEPVLSVKTKFASGSASRYVKVYQEGNRISVLSGKIDTIFDADAMILRIIRNRLL